MLVLTSQHLTNIPGTFVKNICFFLWEGSLTFTYGLKRQSATKHSRNTGRNLNKQVKDKSEKWLPKIKKEESKSEQTIEFEERQSHEDKTLRNEFNKKFQKDLRRDKKQYYSNIYKDIKNENTGGEKGNSSKQSQNSGQDSNLELVCQEHP